MAIQAGHGISMNFTGHENSSTLYMRKTACNIRVFHLSCVTASLSSCVARFGITFLGKVVKTITILESPIMQPLQ